jgi:ribosome-associated translation inhibitor RaiA
MIIQFNTDKTVSGSEGNVAEFIAKIEDDLRRFSTHITRIEVHLSDENGKKRGLKDIRCLMEARLEGRQPMAVSTESDTVSQAINGALDKLTASLSKILDRMSNQ